MTFENNIDTNRIYNPGYKPGNGNVRLCAEIARRQLRTHHAKDRGNFISLRSRNSES